MSGTAEPFDLVVIGGWVNGAGMARDAAGRGLRVLMCEKGDLGEGTSSRSGKLIHRGKFWEGPHAYLLQNDDKRVIFVNPYEGDLCLIGTTDVPFDDPAQQVAVSQAERDYLLRVVNRYMRHQLRAEDILHEYSGVRPLYDDDAAKNASAVTRDYVFDVDAPEGQAPVLSVFGGKITTCRKPAEHALEKLAPHLPGMGQGHATRAA